MSVHLTEKIFTIRSIVRWLFRPSPHPVRPRIPGESIHGRLHLYRAATHPVTIWLGPGLAKVMYRSARFNEGFLVLQVGVGSTVSASLAYQIENAKDRPDGVNGAGA